MCRNTTGPNECDAVHTEWVLATFMAYNLTSEKHNMVLKLMLNPLGIQQFFFYVGKCNDFTCDTIVEELSCIA